jgi:DNA-binding NtrC family response regulator
MERAAVLTGGSMIEAEVFPEEIKDKGNHIIVGRADGPEPPVALPHTPARIVSLEELERKAILETLSLLGNNVTETAKQLGISKATLYRKIKRYNISRRVVVGD